ncbi:MAG TPA: sulfotransferase family 2 domain-containing protein [Rhizomicrobium sp.]
MKEGRISSFDRISLRLRHSSRSLGHFFAGKRSRPIVFIHVPKTAGNSTINYVQACVGTRRPRGYYMVHDNETRLGREVDIRRARKAEFVFGHMSWQTFDEIRNGRNVFAFTFLRDPLDRLLSNYSFLKVIKRPAHAEKHFPGIAGMSLAEYAACTHPRFRYGLDNFMVRQFAGRLEEYPDEAYPASQMLDHAKAHLSSLDFVGFTDRYDEDFSRLVDRARLPRAGITPRYNVTRQANITKESPEVSDAIRDLLLARVRLDLELWEFARQRFR